MTNINEQNTAAVSVKYNGSTIAEIGVGGKETLDCVGKCMKSNVEISCVMEEYSGDVTVILAPGLYDSEDQLIASWSELGIDNTCSNAVDAISRYAMSFPYKIVLSNAVTNIAYAAFDGLGISVVIAQNGLLTIGNRAFAAGFLASITLPDTLTSIGDNCFYSASDLRHITFNGTKTQWNGITKGTNWDQGTHNCTVHCIDGDIILS